jgi:DNA-binding GntR family transcriptional regulator
MYTASPRRRFVAGQSLTETAYRSLKGRISSRRLSPGTPLFEVPLALELKMSRTPVREAIRRLAHEGLVDLWPAKGAFVRGIPLKRIHEIFEIRLLVEPHVTSLACGHIPRERLERVRVALRRILSEAGSTPEQYHRVGDELHRLILRFSGNEAMQEWIQKSKTEIDRACYFAMRRPGVAQRLATQHLAVAEYLLAGDADGAARAMAEHIATVRDSVMGSQDDTPPSPRRVQYARDGSSGRA